MGLFGCCVAILSKTGNYMTVFRWNTAVGKCQNKDTGMLLLFLLSSSSLLLLLLVVVVVVMVVVVVVVVVCVCV